MAIGGVSTPIIARARSGSMIGSPSSVHSITGNDADRKTPTLFDSSPTMRLLDQRLDVLTATSLLVPLAGLGALLSLVVAVRRSSVACARSQLLRFSLSCAGCSFGKGTTRLCDLAVDSGVSQRGLTSECSDGRDPADGTTDLFFEDHAENDQRRWPCQRACRPGDEAKCVYTTG
jgi:hypothetical protein